jgi:hypothetical protein
MAPNRHDGTTRAFSTCTMPVGRPFSAQAKEPIILRIRSGVSHFVCRCVSSPLHWRRVIDAISIIIPLSSGFVCCEGNCGGEFALFPGLQRFCYGRGVFCPARHGGSAGVAVQGCGKRSLPYDFSGQKMAEHRYNERGYTRGCSEKRAGPGSSRDASSRNCGFQQCAHPSESPDSVCRSLEHRTAPRHCSPTWKPPITHTDVIGCLQRVGFGRGWISLSSAR